MKGEGSGLMRLLRVFVVLSAVTAGAALAAFLVYTAYVYRLWAHAMNEEGVPAKTRSA